MLEGAIIGGVIGGVTAVVLAIMKKRKDAQGPGDQGNQDQGPDHPG